DHKIHIEESFKINHLATPEDLDKSYDRNVKFLLDEYKRDKENTDPRTLAYLGRMLLAVGNHNEALFFLEKHIQHSGWDEDRYASWCQIAEIMRQKGEYEQAIGAAFEGVQERPDYPEAYFKLHDTYQEREEWDKAIHWGTEGLKRPIPKTFTLLDPSAYGWRPALSLSFCYFKKGDFINAKKFFDIADKAAPSLSFIKTQRKLYQEGYDQTIYMQHLMWIVQYLQAKDKKKLKDLIHSIPDNLQEHEVVSSLKNTFLDPRIWGDKEIAIYCGTGGEEWTPKIISTGIGGSEEAIIYLSGELTKLGYKITVFNNCGENEGDYDGVTFLNSHKFNPHDGYNKVISWRVNVFPFIDSAKQRILWLHDIPKNIEWSEETVKGIDKVVVLSDYHKSLLPSIVAEEKVFVSTNGIQAEDFNDLPTNERDPKRIIYAS
ncbi:MAG: tetratricopeptide repeat protein, partial [bacterium]|nr:tetratricopeptide repeat protein [bacterium]